MKENIAKPARIVWLPASPKEGWASMDRYWRELESLEARESVPQAQVTAALPYAAPIVSKSAPRLLKAIDKNLLYPLRVRRVRADVVHILDHSYAHLLQHVAPGIKTMVTVFDLVPLLDRTGLNDRQVERFRRTVQCIAKADMAVSVSKQTAGDLERYAGVAADQIEVVYPGTDLATFTTAQAPCKSEQLLPKGAKTVLSVGSTVGRKNLASLPHMLAPISALFQSGECCLVRVGQRLDAGLASELLQLLGPKGFVELGPVFGSDLARLYQLAHVFLMPSTLEGFSFTMMEAMAAGAPVLTNRLSTNPEVGKDAVPYYEEGDYQTASRLLHQLLTDEEVRKDWSQRARARAAELSWSAHWLGIRNLYQKLLQP